MAVNKTVEQVVFEGVDKITGVSKQAQAAIAGLRTSIGSVQSALAAVGVTVGAGAMTAIYLDALKATAALDDMAERTGASVEGLSAIQRVAKIGGHDMEGFAGQIGKMVKGLKDGSQEGGKAAQALAFLDIKTRDAGGRFRDTSEIVVELALKLRGYADDGAKVQLVQDALGKGAERYIPLLKDMADGTDLHATVTRQQAERAEQAEKNIKRLTTAMEENRRELVNQYTPALNNWLEKLIAASAATGGVASGLAFMAMRPLGGGDMSGEQIQARLGQIEKAIAGHEKAISDTEGGRWRAPAYAGGGQIGIQVSAVGQAMSGVQIGRLMHERAYLERLQANRLRGLIPEGSVEDAAGIHAPPAAARLGYGSSAGEGGAGGSREEARREQEIRDIMHREGEARDRRELDQIKLKQDREQAFLVALSDGALARQKKQEEYEAREEEIADNRRKRAAEEINLVLAASATKEEVERETYRRQVELLDQAGHSQEEYQQIYETLYQQHQQRLTDIQDEHEARKFHITKVHRELNLDSAQTFFGAMSGLMNTENRKMFEIGKAAAIAESTISTYRAAMGAYAALSSIPYVGPALGAAAAAAIMIAGVANVSNIASTSFGGGGPRGVGTFPVNTNTGQPLPQSQQAPQQTTIVQFRGTQSEQQLLRNFVRMLNENQRDGGRIILDES